jgi:hypothetical protein
VPKQPVDGLTIVGVDRIEEAMAKSAISMI